MTQHISVADDKQGVTDTIHRYDATYQLADDKQGVSDIVHRHNATYQFADDKQVRN